MKYSRRQSCGFTLIEVLVAMLVLAIGLMGIAGLQVFGVQGNASALNKNLAAQLAYDLADRVRANPNVTYAIDFAAAPPAPTNCMQAAANCSPSTMATFDLAQWKCSMGTYAAHANCANIMPAAVMTLPLGDGQIRRNGSRYSIQVRWLDDRRQDMAADDGPALQTFVMDFSL